MLSTYRNQLTEIYIFRKLPFNGFSTGIYSVKANNGNTFTMYEICSKLTIRTPEENHWHRSGVFTVNSEQISYIVLVFLMLTLNK